MATQVPCRARLDVPAWFWGGSMEGYLSAARLKTVGTPAENGGRTVEALEREPGRRPNLVNVIEIAGPAVGRPDFDALAVMDRQSNLRVGLAEIAGERLDQHLDRLSRRAQGGGTVGAFAAAFAMHQLQTSTATSDDLGTVVRAAYEDITEIQLAETDQTAFPHGGVHLIRRSDALGYRTKLAPVLLRLTHDERLRSADVSAAQAANARGEVVFASSRGLSDGFALLDPYLAPLFGALTPFVWAFPASRASGTIVYTLGSTIAGTEGDAAEPLQLLPTRGAEEPSSAARLGARSAGAAIHWWVRRLDTVLSIISDPAVYTDSSGQYVPSKHLHAQLSIEQLFRRTASIQQSHRDTDARRVLLFTVLDTLERLTSRSLTTMCTLSFAEKTVQQLRKSLSTDVASVLLPAAERSVHALESVQTGLYMTAQLGLEAVEFEDSEGVVQRMTAEDASAEYIRVLRNATHGHGSNREHSKLRTDALLAHHDGRLHHDLALLSYLYLLDLLDHPDKLRRTLYDGGKT